MTSLVTEQLRAKLNSKYEVRLQRTIIAYRDTQGSLRIAQSTLGYDETRLWRYDAGT